MEQIILIVLLVLCFLVGLICYRFGKSRTSKEVRLSNDKVLQERNAIQAQITQQKQRIKDIEDEYNSKKALINDAKEIAAQEHKSEVEKYQLQIENLKADFQHKYNEYYKVYKVQYDTMKADLDSLKNQKAAAIEALQKEKAIAAQADLYRLDISRSDLEDIALLRSIQYKLSKPRILAMLIWQTYYLPIAKKKFPNILGGKEVCGIYKITNTKTEKCYIGQAVNIKNRFYEHCKCGLGIDMPQGNKLYQAMLEDGLESFTFELLEQCSREELDRKEKYYIELYNSIDFGYNSQSGTEGQQFG